MASGIKVLHVVLKRMKTRSVIYAKETDIKLAGQEDERLKIFHVI
jgi:hypothetical protein